MRITTNMIMRNYQSNLESTLGGLERSRTQVETGRKFASSYEDPASSAKGMILEHRYSRNADYLNRVQDTQKWQDSQEDVLNQLGTVAKNISENYGPSAITGTTGDVQRAAYAQTLRELQKSMVSSLNTKYGDAFVMAGEDGAKAPFELTADGKVTYRGIDLSSTDPDDIAALEKMSKESSYVDLGFGMSFDSVTGEVVPASAFNAAFPGINAVGFGQTDEGVNKNIIVLAGEMADYLEKDPFDEAAEEGYKEVWMQFRKGEQNLENQYTMIGTRTQLLTATEERLTNEKMNLTKQYKGTAGLDEAEAITNFTWSQYVYNTALKIGTSIISPSLLDFMN